MGTIESICHGLELLRLTRLRLASVAEPVARKNESQLRQACTRRPSNQVRQAGHEQDLAIPLNQAFVALKPLTFRLTRSSKVA